MRQRLRGYTDGLIALAPPSGGTSLATLAAETSAVRNVVDGSQELRSVLSDTGVPLPARRGVVDDLFGPHVGPATMNLLNFVLEADRAPETAANIDWLAVRLDAAKRQMQPIGDVVLGHRGAEERIDGFATAVLATLENDQALARVEDELFRFSQVLADSEPLKAALTSRDIPPANRAKLVTDLLAGKASEATTVLATYATQVGRPRDFEDLLQALINRVAAESNRRVAEVRSAVALDEAQRRSLAAALGRAVGHDVEVRVTVDPSVIAGFVATVGDTVVDGTARHQLQLLKERLVTPEVRITTGESR